MRVVRSCWVQTDCDTRKRQVQYLHSNPASPERSGSRGRDCYLRAVRVFGADENGLGPRLGPLIASGVTLELGNYRSAALRKRGEALGITDSKANSGFGRMALAESVTLAALERVYGEAPRTADSLFADLSIDGMMGLRAPCPSGETARQCWANAPELPLFGGDLQEGRDRIKALEGRSVLRIARVRSVIVCAGVLNHELSLGRTKLEVDLHAFERLIADARASGADPLLAICGMVGGIRKYEQYFGRFPAEHVHTIEERKGCSSYSVDGVGEVRFEVSADAHHLPVALASMVGKYLREVAMERLNRYYAGHDSALPKVSGYHDPRTKAFVSASEPLRYRLQIADACFERRG